MIKGSVMKKFSLFSMLLILSVSNFAKGNLFDEVTDLQHEDTSTYLECSLRGHVFKQKCAVDVKYIGSTLNDAVTINFPNGKEAKYHVISYENPVPLYGVGDKNAKYIAISSDYLMEIKRNNQSWITLWKPFLKGKHYVKRLNIHGNNLSVRTNKRNFTFNMNDINANSINNLRWSKRTGKPVCIINSISHNKGAFVYKNCK